MSTYTFSCGKCRKVKPVAGSKVERYLGIPTRLCHGCTGARPREQAERSHAQHRRTGHEA